MKKIVYIVVLLLSINCKPQNNQTIQSNTETKESDLLKAKSSNEKQSEYEALVRDFLSQQIMVTDMLFYKKNEYYFNNASKYLEESISLLKKEDISSTCKLFIISLMHGLEFDDYMLFSNKVLDLYENDQISIDLLSDLYMFEKYFKPNFYDNRNTIEIERFTKRFYSSNKIPQKEKDYLKKYLEGGSNKN